MARQLKRLSALDVSRAKKRGKRRMYADGGGLYLQVSASGAASWVYRFMLNGTAQWMGLGPLHDVPLADARVAASEKRELRRAGVNPIKARNDALDASRLDAARSITFKDAAERYMAAHKAGWRNDKHADQWRNTLETYAYPGLGSLPVQGVDVALVMKVLEPIWATKTETASRVRQRIESILDWASARGYRLGENPARWRGHIDKLLPSRSKVQKVEHYPALPYDEVGAFMADLRKQQGTAARALEFLILTTSRTAEAIGARWGEFNIGKALWTVPAERVKSERTHRVPLSSPAIKVVNAMQKERSTESDGGLVFPVGKRGRGLSNMGILALLKRMGRRDLTVHGFRSTLRDWAAERTSYPSEAAEMALGHIVSDKVEAAYRRGDLFEKRRKMMDAWADYCGTVHEAGADKVVPLWKDV